MAIVTMKALLESGVHFGHRTHKWNPAMKPFIFTERNGIHIIDLQKTSKALDEAYALVRNTVADGGTLLFVGTKRQAQETIQLEAVRCNMPFVTARWLGGMLTNWRTIRQRINELERLERMRESGEFSRITKKEALLLTRKIERLEGLLGGVRKMARLPDLLFIVDVFREETAIHEANLLDIPVVAMVDTNCDPRYVDYIIPSNDDAIRAIKLVVGKMADAVLEGLGMRKEEPEEEKERVIARAGLEEPELSDEELLGEATLAKLTSQVRVLDEDEEVVEAEEEDVDEEDLDEEEEDLDEEEEDLDEEEEDLDEEEEDLDEEEEDLDEEEEDLDEDEEDLEEDLDEEEESIDDDEESIDEDEESIDEEVEEEGSEDLSLDEEADESEVDEED
jgi:small subunit ribosomal protein S2